MLIQRTLPTLLIVASLVSATPAARAATQGTLGSSSTGTAEITLSKGEAVLISQITDVHFPAWTPGDGAQSQDGQACVYSSTGLYSIQASSANGVGGFELDDGAGNALEYTLSWIDDQSGANPVALNTGQVSTTTMSGSASQSCTDLGGTNARFRVNIGQGDLASTPSGTYSDVLTLTVSTI